MVSQGSDEVVDGVAGFLHDLLSLVEEHRLLDPHLGGDLVELPLSLVVVVHAAEEEGGLALEGGLVLGHELGDVGGNLSRPDPGPDDDLVVSGEVDLRGTGNGDGFSAGLLGDVLRNSGGVASPTPKQFTLTLRLGM